MLRLCILLGISLFFFFEIQGQEHYRVVSYNVENFFDTKPDTLTQDRDFTPGGRLHWNTERYTAKLLKIAGVIEAVGEGDFPAFVGLCEVENRKVLSDLVSKTQLAEADYGIVHQDSPDPRGIDVALLYRKKYFRVLKEVFLPVALSGEKKNYSRDVLQVTGILQGQDSLFRDTLHFFVCHFPSMSGGEAESEWKREKAALVVKNRVDTLLKYSPNTALLILGDLNGKANRPAQAFVLHTLSSDSRQIENSRLYNTGYYLLHRNKGSYKYKGQWQTIDHILVSGNLLNGQCRLQAGRRLQVFAPLFLLEEDKTYYGYKPFRTYSGPRYVGGYSDHLPLYLDLFFRKF